MNKKKVSGALIFLFGMLILVISVGICPYSGVYALEALACSGMGIVIGGLLTVVGGYRYFKQPPQQHLQPYYRDQQPPPEYGPYYRDEPPPPEYGPYYRDEPPPPEYGPYYRDEQPPSEYDPYYRDEQPPIPPLEKQKSKKPIYALGVVSAILAVAIALVIIFAALNNGSEPDWVPQSPPPDWWQPTPPPSPPSPPSGSFSMHYSWSYKGNSWTWDFAISEERYYYYKDKPRTDNLVTYVTDTDDLVEGLAQKLKEAADKEGYHKSSFIMAFVQSLPYTSDDVTTGYNEYPRYPIETLVDNGGDCEDTAILLAALIQADPINIDAVLFLIPSDNPTHVATGIWITGDMEGVYYEYNGRRYYYCETTGDGFEIGDVPPEFEGVSARIIEV